MSEETEAIKVAVGDYIAFNVGYGSRKWIIHEVKGITKTGRIKCGEYTLDPDLRIRGVTGYARVYRGHVVTDKIRAEYKRQCNISRITGTDFNKLSDDDLESMVKILNISNYTSAQ